MGFSNVHGIPGLPGIFRKANVLDGRAAAAAVRGRVAKQVEQRIAAGQSPPSLATIMIGDDPACEVCVSAAQAATVGVGIGFSHHPFEADAPSEEVEACVTSLSDDPAINGILLQLPVPAHLDPRRLLELIDPRKDVDSLTKLNMSRLGEGSEHAVPCTARGILALLDHHEIELAGRRAVVIGRSELVGRPVATLLSRRDATVTICHSRSRDLHAECRRADILIVAAGRAHLIGDEHVAHGAVVIDVGIHRRAGGMVGDVDFDAVRGRVRAVSPVPGGVGPMTIASLLESTLEAASLQAHA